MIIVGHRGVAGHFPENTRCSVEAAIALGLKWVEVDIQPTKDNQLVVCHDHTINRCSNGRGRVDRYTLDELKQFDFGRWFDRKFANQSIMTLNELLNLAVENKLKLNLEVKIDRHDPMLVCQLLAKELGNSQAITEDIVLSSFNHDIIRCLHQLIPDYRLAVLCDRVTTKVERLLKQVSAFSCNVNYKFLSNSKIYRLQAEGYQVWSYTVNNPKSLRHLSNLDAIFSDFPQRFLAHNPQ
ncbi:glycerophosphodiester phosphodiesterase family protein [Vibrio sp. TRT 1302]|uniref:glycerophosphodiester phosphodiesterase family protein n=1 Tax=Vibrio sp. TRT 1302 TaxID=3418504 RepID=UPI003CED4B47